MFSGGIDKQYRAVKTPERHQSRLFWFLQYLQQTSVKQTSHIATVSLLLTLKSLFISRLLDDIHTANAYSEPCQTSKKECFAKIVNC